MKPWLKNLLALGLLAIVAGAVYSNALHSSFMMDDYWMFQEDRVAYTRAKAELLIFHKPIPPQWQEYDLDLSYRPLSQILPIISYLVFKNNFLAYHSVNLLLFILCVFMIFYFLITLFKDFKTALMAALLFAAHPVNSLMVNYISAHIFSIQLLLMIVSCLLFVRHRTNNYFSLATSLGCFFLATLCHESALILPLFLTGLAVTVLNLDVKEAAKKLWPFYGLALVLGFFWFFKVLHTNEMFLFKEKLQMPWTYYPAGIAQLIMWYVTKLLFLHGVLLMYVLPKEEIHVLYGWSIIVLTSAFLISTRRLRAKDRQTFWALGWFGIGLLTVIAGAKFQPAYGLTIEPHWLYFGSLGLFFIAAKGLKMFEKYHPRLPLILSAFLIISYGLATHRLNHLWADKILYGQYFMANNPDFEKARIFLADAYFREGFYQEAEQLYLTSFKHTPRDWLPFNNLGIAADMQGRYDDALGYFRQALAVNPDMPGLLSNTAIVYTKTGRLNEAQHLLERAIALNPWLLSPRINLATVYEKQGRIDQAFALLEENLKISPGDVQTISLIIDLQFQYADFQTVWQSARRLSDGSRDPHLFIYLGTLFCKNQHITEGYDFYKKAMDMAPGVIAPYVCRLAAGMQGLKPPSVKSAEAYIDMGRALYRIGETEKAIELWKKTLEIVPHHTELLQILNAVNLKTKKQE